MKQPVQPSTIQPIKAPEYVPNMQMRQVAERLKGMPRPVPLSSKVSNFRYMEG